MTRRALLCLQGWEGRTETPVLVVGETPKRYRIRSIEPTKLSGRHRWIGAGEEVLVPKLAIKFTPADARP